MDKQKYDELLDVLDSLQELQVETTERWLHESEDYWNSLDQETQQMVFCAVVRRIYKGEIKEQGSYRHVLYDSFGFDTDSYGRAMDAGYLTIHNRLLRDDDVDCVEHVSHREMEAKRKSS